MKDADSRPNPYVGPRAFLTGETLYGRDRELRELLNFLLSQRIVLLYSPSGAGKTSLVQAGLIPALADKGFSILPVIRVNHEPPPAEELYQGADAASAPALNRYIYSALLSLEEKLPEEQQTPAKTLAGLSLEDYLSQRPAQDAASESGQTGVEVLIFDQFEEILTINPTDQAQKAAFFSQVGDALLHRHRWVVFSMREDYIAALDPYLRLLPTSLRSRYRLDLLGVDAALQAIQRPARQVGVDFTDQAAVKLVNDLRRVQVQRPDGSLETQSDPYIEPVQLQVVCNRLWGNLASDDQEISEEDVAQIGDVNQSLSEYYSEELASIASKTGHNERLIRDWFERKLITEHGFRSQVLMSPERSEGLENQVIRELVNAHLVRAERRRGATWYELAHDRLIEPVRRNNAAWFQANLSPLQRQAALWEEEGRPEGLLWPDRLPAPGLSGTLNPLETEFVQASQLAAQRQQREKRTNRLVRILAVGALLAAVLAVFFGARTLQANQAISQNAAENARIAVTSQANAQTAIAAQATAQAAYLEALDQRATAIAAQVTAQAAYQEADAERANAISARMAAQENFEEARRQAEIALSRQLAAQAQGYQEKQPDLAALLSIEAYQAADTFEARDVLLTNLQQKVAGTLQELVPAIPSDANDITSVSLSSDGQHLAYGTTGGAIVIWNYRNRQPAWKTTSGEAGRIISLDWHPDGQTLAYAAGDGRIYTLRIPAITEQAGLSKPEELFPGSQRVPIWRIPDLSYNPDRSRLAFGAGASVVVLDTSKQTESWYTFGSTVESVDWSSDGKWLAVGLSDNTVRVLNATSLETSFLYRAGPSITRSERSPLQRQMSVAWMPVNSTSRLLAMAGQPGKIVLLDISQGKPVAEVETNQEIYSLAFASDGSVLATGGIDSFVKLWRVPDLAPIDEIEKHNRMVVDLDFSPIIGSALFASASYDNSVRVFQLAQPSPLAELIQQNNKIVIGINASQEGPPQTVLLALNAQIGSYALKEMPESYALSDSGKSLALGFADGSVEILDLEALRQSHTFQVASSPVLALAWKPDGRSLAFSWCDEQSLNFAQQLLCDRNEIGILDIQSGEVVKMPQAYPDYIRALAYDPQSGLLAAGSDDRSIQIWDTDSGARVGVSLKNHLAGVTSLTFSPDGRLLASGSADQTVILWDTRANAPIGEPFSGFSDKITSLTFSLDGLALYTSDSTLLRWDVDPLSWVKRNCALAGRRLNEAEWAQFLPSWEYSPSCAQNP